MKDKQPKQTAGRSMISLRKWRGDIGVSRVTVWRWERQGWLRTCNISGKKYLSQGAIDEFEARAAAGEFAKSPSGAVNAKAA